MDLWRIQDYPPRYAGVDYAREGCDLTVYAEIEMQPDGSVKVVDMWDYETPTPPAT